MTRDGPELEALRLRLVESRIARASGYARPARGVKPARRNAGEELVLALTIDVRGGRIAQVLGIRNPDKLAGLT